MAAQTVTTAETEQAVRWLLEHTPPAQWVELALALRLLQEHSGFGRITLLVKDGRIAPHSKVEISL